MPQVEWYVKEYNIPEGDWRINALKMLEVVYGGLHHCPMCQHDKIDKALCNKDGLIEFNHYGAMSTYDFDMLTRLVFAAHDFCIRVELQSRAFGYFRIRMWPRDAQATTIMDGHPTIEGALKHWRERHPQRIFPKETT